MHAQQALAGLAPAGSRAGAAAAARIGWLLVAVPSAVLFLASLPPELTRTLAAVQPPGGFAPEMSAEAWRDALAALGITPAGYAAMRLAILLALALGFWAVGGLLWWRRPDDRGAVIVSLVLVMFGSTFPNTLDALDAVHPALAVAGQVLGAAGFAGLPLLLLVFPDGRFVPRWTRWVAVVAGTELVLAETGSTWWAQRPGWLGAAMFAAGAGCLLYAPAYRYRRVSGPVERQQTKWVALGLVAAIATFLGLAQVAALVPAFATPGPAAVAYELIAIPVLVLALLAVPATIAVAVLRHRLYEIDVLLGRALVYVVLTAILLGLYLGVVAAARAVLPTAGTAADLLAAALVAVLFAPLRARLQRLANRLLYGDRDDPYAALARLGARLEATGDPASALPAVAETVAQTLRLPSAAISLGPDVVASWGTPRGEPVVLPLLHQHEQVGELRLSLRAGERTLSAADRRLLDDLALRAGAAAHAAVLDAQLRSARQELVTAREEERRRLRRDLHDGLGPELSGQALTIDAVRALLRTDPERAESLLVDIKAQVRGGVDEVRRLVHGLRPPALDDLGLLGALREGAARQSVDGLRITLDAPPELPPLPAAVEVAALRIAQEALTNVVRHAGARTATVRVAADARRLELEVRDDGAGLPAAPARGVGLSSMRERAGELGGTLSVTAAPGGGTVVRAALPLGAT
ncbi:MAG TPA: sensor histidine kinase [Pseudonocardia sp.]|nr:sensor histidine kinase [Pseudonocardia sp.]